MLDQAAAPVTADDAVRRLLRARIDDAYKLAMFILHDPAAAEDAVQEAALLAWDRRRTLRDNESADGWFTRILVNVCRDELRRRARWFGVGLGVGMNGSVQAEAGPLRQFDPDPNPKIAPPPPDHWVWRVRFVGPISTSFVILDYYTGQYIEAGIATP